MTRTSIRRSDPFRELDRLGRVFDSFFAATPAGSFPAMPVDIYETDSALIIRAAVPGLAPEQIDVSIEESVLTISGEHRHESELAEAKVYRREITTGKASRSVRLPEGLDLDNVSAEFDNGFVTVRLPKMEPVKPESRRIAVRPALQGQTPESLPDCEQKETAKN